MKGFHKVITFKMWNTYNNVRAIADDIIESMNAHISSEDDTVTYSSTIKHSLIWSIGDCFDGTSNKDDEYALWIIRIYKCDGNRGSRLASYYRKDKPESIDTKTQTLNDSSNSFIQNYMQMYRLNSVLKFTMDKYNSMKALSDEKTVSGIKIECRDRIHKLVEYIEFLDHLYPVEMKQRETEVNDVIRHIATCINLFEADEHPEAATDIEGDNNEETIED